MKNKNIELTNKEREMIDNFCKDGESSKEFGNLNVRNYFGNNSHLRGMNGTAKIIGTAQYIAKESRWYFYAMDGETYRIPEPDGGIDTILDIEFKRNKHAEDSH